MHSVSDMPMWCLNSDFLTIRVHSSILLPQGHLYPNFDQDMTSDGKHSGICSAVLYFRKLFLPNQRMLKMDKRYFQLICKSQDFDTKILKHYLRKPLTSCKFHSPTSIIDIWFLFNETGCPLYLCTQSSKLIQKMNLTSQVSMTRKIYLFKLQLTSDYMCSVTQTSLSFVRV